ncbi:MAG: hypothetical protein QXH80_00885 [Candidatus Nanoarchaeia archaeon]
MLVKITHLKSPTVLRVEGYFFKDPEKGHLANQVWGRAVSGHEVGQLKEVLVVTGTSKNGKGAYAIALDPMYFNDGKRYCRTEVYTEVSRTEEEIMRLAVCSLPTNYELPLEIIKMLPNAFSIKTHFTDDNLVLKILDSDKAIDLLDDLHCMDIPFAEPRNCKLDF